MNQPAADRHRAKPASMATSRGQSEARDDRFWMGLLYAGLAAYAAVVFATLGYTVLTWNEANRGWLAALAVGAMLSAAMIHIFRQDFIAPRWRLVKFSVWNMISYVFIVTLCMLDGGIASPLSSFYILPVLFLAIGYPLRVVVVCGCVSMVGFLALAAISPGPLPVFTMSIQMVALIVGILLATLGATNRDRESRSLLALQRQLEQMATTDALSGCLNQRAFHAALTHEMERAARYRHAVSLLMIDVDRFKSVNDQNGHLMGDEILRGVGTVIRASARNVDVCGRIGGDEFAILAPETDQADAMALADRVLQHMRQHPTPVRTTLSIGVCALMPDMEQAATLLRRADKALYEAKKRGRDQTVGYHEVDAAPRPAAPARKNVV